MSNNNTKLSNWLLASDIDGTLNNKFRLLPKRNYDAIQKYVYQYDGHFILASGRSIESMRKHFNKLNLNSGYAVFTNGAGVYDYSKEQVLWLCPIKSYLRSIIKKISHQYKHVGVQIVTPTEVYLINPKFSAYILALSSRLKIKKFKSIDELPEENWCKVIFTGLPSQMKRLARSFTEANGGETRNLMSSSIVSFEVVSLDTNKGVAVLKTAELLGIDKEKTAAIGDYFNDYQMLKTVAVGAACGQAPRKMKEIAKLVTCHCNRGAVADLIEYLIANNTNS